MHIPRILVFLADCTAASTGAGWRGLLAVSSQGACSLADTGLEGCVQENRLGDGTLPELFIMKITHRRPVHETTLE